MIFESLMMELNGIVLLIPMNLMGLIYLKGICLGVGLDNDKDEKGYIVCVINYSGLFVFVKKCLKLVCND